MGEIDLNNALEQLRAAKGSASIELTPWTAFLLLMILQRGFNVTNELSDPAIAQYDPMLDELEKLIGESVPEGPGLYEYGWYASPDDFSEVVNAVNRMLTPKSWGL